MFVVGRQVNNAANDSPDLILPVEGVTEEEATTKNTKNAKSTDASEQFFLGELLAPVRPRSPG
jgi:hypothetical protein